jgi:acetolactate synthase I/III small subunit
MSLQNFVIYVEDKPGVLSRVAALFRRRDYNITSIQSGPCHQSGVQRMTVQCDASADLARRIEANLYKIVSVLLVERLPVREAVAQQLALIKVRAGLRTRAEVMQICQGFRTRILDVGAEALIAEISDTSDKIDDLMLVLEPYGILEAARTGALAMSRCSASANLIHWPTKSAA